MDREKREKNFNIFAKRLTQSTSDYERQRKQIDEAAKEDGVSLRKLILIEMKTLKLFGRWNLIIKHSCFVYTC